LEKQNLQSTLTNVGIWIVIKYIFETVNHYIVTRFVESLFRHCPLACGMSKWVLTLCRSPTIWFLSTTDPVEISDWKPHDGDDDTDDDRCFEMGEGKMWIEGMFSIVRHKSSLQQTEPGLFIRLVQTNRTEYPEIDSHWNHHNCSITAIWSSSCEIHSTKAEIPRWLMISQNRRFFIFIEYAVYTSCTFSLSHVIAIKINDLEWISLNKIVSWM
jgi:hypothetical protein